MHSDFSDDKKKNQKQILKEEELSWLLGGSGFLILACPSAPQAMAGKTCVLRACFPRKKISSA